MRLETGDYAKLRSSISNLQSHKSQLSLAWLIWAEIMQAGSNISRHEAKPQIPKNTNIIMLLAPLLVNSHFAPCLMDEPFLTYKDGLLY